MSGGVVGSIPPITRFRAPGMGSSNPTASAFDFF